MAKLYRVELQICTGHSKPIPIPSFPELPHYAFAVMGPAESKTSARARSQRLAELNPGYAFSVAEVIGGGAK